MRKNYNYQRTKLMLPEYGRHVYQMIEYLLSIEDRELRNQQARLVIDVMGNINPTLRDTADFKHKLWDHLFIISNFSLDVDSPYPIPAATSLYPRPDTLKYPNRRIRFKHYGKSVEHMLSSIKTLEDEQAKTEVAANIARYMQAKSFEYNQEHPNTEVILKDIRNMSDHCIAIDETAINPFKSDYKPNHTNNRPRKNYGMNPKNGVRQNNKSNGKRKLIKMQHKQS